MVATSVRHTNRQHNIIMLSPNIHVKGYNEMFNLLYYCLIQFVVLNKYSKKQNCITQIYTFTIQIHGGHQFSLSKTYPDLVCIKLYITEVSPLENTCPQTYEIPDEGV